MLQLKVLIKLVKTALGDMKAVDVCTIDVCGKSSITDALVIASGTSTRHVRSLAENVLLSTKKAGYPALGVEGSSDAEWVLVDLNSVVVHVMLPRTRKFYNLEKLWTTSCESE